MNEAKPWRVILDVEGVVFDPLPAIVAAVRRALLRMGRPVSTGRDLAWVAEVPLQTTLSTLVGQEWEAHRAFLGHLQHYYRSQCWRGLHQHPGVADALRKARHGAGAEIILVSGHDMDTAWRQVTEQGLDDVFDSVVCPEHGCCPHCRQQMLVQLIKESRESHRIVWLTDMPPELAEARRQGVYGVAAAWGRAPLRMLRMARPTVMASGPAEIGSTLQLPAAWLESLMRPWSQQGRDSAPAAPC